MDLADFCATKDGTFGTLEMLLNQDVDVIFGPICSSGTLQAHTKPAGFDSLLVRTVHNSVLMTVHNCSTQCGREEF